MNEREPLEYESPGPTKPRPLLFVFYLLLISLFVVIAVFVAIELIFPSMYRDP